MYCR
ncbi:hypothetical protein ECEC4402_4713, partial [Escherichia coli EC4402]